MPRKYYYNDLKGNLEIVKVHWIGNVADIICLLQSNDGRWIVSYYKLTGIPRYEWWYGLRTKLGNEMCEWTHAYDNWDGVLEDNQEFCYSLAEMHDEIIKKGKSLGYRCRSVTTKDYRK